jgi:hypothetical protein
MPLSLLSPESSVLSPHSYLSPTSGKGEPDEGTYTCTAARCRSWAVGAWAAVLIWGELDRSDLAPCHGAAVQILIQRRLAACRSRQSRNRPQCGPYKTWNASVTDSDLLLGVFWRVRFHSLA